MSPASGVRPFERFPRRYDAWFEGEEGRKLFPLEVEALRPLLEGLEPPFVEVGVGTGRFAQALGVGLGVDPALPMLELARGRVPAVVAGTAEALPLRGGSFGAVLLVVTLCFLRKPAAAVAEAARVLRPYSSPGGAGALLVGMVPRDSAWGRLYSAKAASGHPFYGAARFYTAAEVCALAESAGLVPDGARSTLLFPPGGEVTDRLVEGVHEEAGFVAMRFRRSCSPVGGCSAGREGLP